MSGARPRPVVRTAARRAGGIGALLAVTLLAACSDGGTEPSAGVSSAGVSSAAAAATESAQSTTAGSADSSSAVPAPAPYDQPVATDSPAPQTTDVVLSFIGWNAKTNAVEAGGYISPVVETGGTCTLELKQGDRKVTVSAPATADASTTACGNLAVARAKLAAGSWSAVLRYASPTTTGSSDPTPVEVPQ